MNEKGRESPGENIISFDGMGWTTAIIRELLSNAFNDEELTAFAFDYFQVASEAFSSGMTKGGKIHRLMDHCYRQRQMEHLLICIRERAYTEYNSFLVGIKLKLIDVAINIPFVVIAMDSTEALQLEKGEVESDLNFHKFREMFQRFREELPDYYGNESWVLHYKENRDDWQPHTHPHNTIGEIISETASYLNIERQKLSLNLPPLRPILRTQDFFSVEHARRRDTWRELAQTGCVLIVDAVSIFHRNIREKLLQSQLSSNERVAMLVLSPVNFSAIPVNALLEQEINRQLEITFERISTEWWDRLYDFGGGNLRTLKRWLYNTLLDAEKIANEKRMHDANRVKMRELVGVELRHASAHWPHMPGG